MKLKKVLTYIVFVGIAVLFSYLAYYVVTDGGEKSIREVYDEIMLSNFYWVGLSMVMGYLAIVSRGLRWKYLLDPLGYRPKTWNSIHSVAIAYLSNLLVPRSGEIARCTTLYSTDDIPVDKLIGTVISERIIDFIFLFFFMFIAVITNLDAFSAFLDDSDMGSILEKTSTLFTIGAIFLAIMIALYFFRKKIRELSIYKKIVSFLMGIKDGVMAVRKMKNKWSFLAHTVFIWTMYALMAIVVFQSMEETKNIPIHQGLFIMVAGGIGMVIPSPGGAGTYPVAVGFAFLALGMSQSVGVQYGFLVWIAQTLMMIIGGFVGLYMIMRAKTKNSKSKNQPEVQTS